MRPFATLSQAVVAILVAALVAGCTDEPAEERAEPTGAEPVQLASSDGLSLHARLWDRGPERLVIYLHEFREDQSAWWPHAEVARNPATSAMTLDFRGHGESEGYHVDVEGMVHDVVAAMTYARDRGFERVMLVGAGMGAAVAIIAAVEVHDVTVVGLSTPADFGALDTVAVVELIADRVQLIAMRDDISAADSLRRFRALPNVDSTTARLYPGSSHGVAILEDPAGPDLRARFEGLLADFWVAPK
jgi:pimeloyl-ACP methyl ester carboxylesterase